MRPESGPEEKLAQGLAREGYAVEPGLEPTDRPRPQPLSRGEVDRSPEGFLNREGGLGIFLVRDTMDAVSYSYEQGQNILTILKTL